MPPVRLPASDGRDVPHLPPRPGVVRCLMEPSGPRIQMVSCTSIILRFAPTAPPFVNPPQPTQTCSSPSHLIQDSIGFQPTDPGGAGREPKVPPAGPLEMVAGRPDSRD